MDRISTAEGSSRAKGYALKSAVFVLCCPCCNGDNLTKIMIGQASFKSLTVSLALIAAVALLYALSRRIQDGLRNMTSLQAHWPAFQVSQATLPQASLLDLLTSNTKKQFIR